MNTFCQLVFSGRSWTASQFVSHGTKTVVGRGASTHANGIDCIRRWPNKLCSRLELGNAGPAHQAARSKPHTFFVAIRVPQIGEFDTNTPRRLSVTQLHFSEKWCAPGSCGNMVSDYSDNHFTLKCTSTVSLIFHYIFEGKCCQSS